MKTRTLLLALLLLVAGYVTYELGGGRNPLQRFTGSVKTETTTTTLAPAPAPAQEAQPASPPVESALVLSAPPRESIEEGDKRFGPMADFLSQALGRKVVYKHPGTWGGYQSDMQSGAYDIVFDGPHFVGWRVEKLGHSVLAKLPGEFLYVGFVRKGNTGIKDIKQLAGQPVCAQSQPNLGTLMLLSEFDNPSRQPVIVITEGYDKIYQGVTEGKCVAGMLPKVHLQKHDISGTYMRVMYSHRAIPEQAITAGPRLSAAEQAKIAEALTAPGTEATLASFREAYAFGGWFVRATNEEYAGLGAYLKPVAGFYN
jgi:ABC-type phosphate/phosphonate transport system substrate-binding protein